jgi:hypothetical protein
LIRDLAVSLLHRRFYQGYTWRRHILGSNTHGQETVRGLTIVLEPGIQPHTFSPRTIVGCELDGGSPETCRPMDPSFDMAWIRQNPYGILTLQIFCTSLH